MRKESVPPEISVILSVYNGQDYLQEAIDTVLNQTFADFELIVVDDGSSDESASIVESCRDDRIRLVKNASNRGLVYSLNKGIELSRGRYLARMDADDLCVTTRFEKQFHFMEKHPEVGVCGAWFELFEDGSAHRRIIRFPVEDKGIRALMPVYSALAHPTVMIRKSALTDRQLSYPDCHRLEDYALWSFLLQHTKAHNFPEVLLFHRRHARNESRLLYRDILKRNKEVSVIHRRFFQMNGVELNEEEAFAYSSFIDKATGFESRFDSDKKAADVMTRILSQLPAHPDTEFAGLLKRNLAKACFGKSVLHRKIYRSGRLHLLFFQGMFAYLRDSFKK